MTLLPFYRQLIISSAAFALIALTLPSHANTGCQLQKGYELPKDIELSALCRFNNDLAPAYKASTNKHGAVNCQGKTVIPFVYSSHIEFSHGRALVKKANQWFLINTKNQKIAEFDFDNAMEFNVSGLARFEKNGKWGFINTDGKVVVKPQFDDIYGIFSYPQMNNKSADAHRYELNGKQGVVDKSGNIIIPAAYDDISLETDIILVANGKKMGMYDYKGNQLHPVEFDKDFGFMFEYQWKNSDWLLISKNGKVGAMDRQGKILVPAIFDDIAMVDEDSFKVKKNGKYGIYAFDNLAVGLQFDDIDESSEGYSRVRYQGKWGYLDPYYSLMLTDYQEVGNFSEGFADVGKDASKTGEKQTSNQKTLRWGYINSFGKEVIAPKYEETKPFHEGLAAVKSKGKWGVINNNEHTIVPFEYDGISSFKEGYAVVGKARTQKVKPSEQKKNDWGMYDRHSRDHLDMYFGLVNRQGSVILPLQYENISIASEGMIGIKSDGKWGFVTQQGETIFPPQFDKIYPPFENNSMQVEDCYDDYNPTSCNDDRVNLHVQYINTKGDIFAESLVEVAHAVSIEEVE